MCNHLLRKGKSKAYSKSYLKCKCLLHFKELNEYERLAFIKSHANTIVELRDLNKVPGQNYALSRYYFSYRWNKRNVN